ncbi:hypothetical protein SPRG_07489 [Saprolegnia parasitica CBS 223.65]|uniref:Anaphase-promoting complex subunit 4 WD40 domain-containing protein n=1 Tax=Saprolegnia parasitica (strain CBS 223.65) TaxID=695850 RepID=A0A067CDL2_SAPPC|nr:hypothetical protein SPRG_07489 [Saprolegnia parasitica CBS 223.65]KDO27240.1 hypothetical protein SPRG_07489 [Saprolegnia parasitica CBS 223.65]|eukprot:XP_012202017.1 hypothetical protein SPRG_07489 [Saprolegnia parasitica CBS 223.65]
MAPAPPSPVGVLRGHAAAVNSVAFLEQGGATYLASGAADGNLKLWDLSIRRPAASISAHSKAGILCVGMLGDALLSHGRDGFLVLWDVANGGVHARQRLACGSYTFTKAMALGAHSILSPLEDAQALGIFDTRVDNQAPALRFNGAALQSGMCMALDVLPSATASDGDPCASFEGGLVARFDVRAPATPVASKRSPMVCMAATPSGTLLGSPSHDMYRMNWETSEASVVYKAKSEGINAIASRPDARIFASGGRDHMVRVFHNRTSRRLATLKFHTDSVYCVAFAADNKLMASSGKDTKIALWSIYPPS